MIIFHCSCLILSSWKVDVYGFINVSFLLGKKPAFEAGPMTDHVAMHSPKILMIQQGYS